jgi:mono/diheme cytochrome c family protein
LNTLPPVTNDRKPTELLWPLNYRVFMRGWDWMFFDPGTFKPDPHQSAEWNRGAYLVTGAAHCGACHTPKNLAGADEESDVLQGGEIQNWFAPKLTNGKRSGLGSWSVDDLVQYLKTGRNEHSGAAGLMAEVVANSTSHMKVEDLHAMAVYIKSLSGEEQKPADKPDQEFVDAGAAIFSDSCSGCHRAEGKGVPGMFPPLAHNANVQSKDPTSVIRVILKGARTVPTDQRPTPFAMPAFEWKLDDDEVAAVATYVRNAWGNSAPAVTADDVKSLRGELQASAN